MGRVEQNAVKKNKEDGGRTTPVQGGSWRGVGRYDAIANDALNRPANRSPFD